MLFGEIKKFIFKEERVNVYFKSELVYTGNFIGVPDKLFLLDVVDYCYKNNELNLYLE